MTKSTLKIQEIVLHPDNYLELSGVSVTNSTAEDIRANIDFQQFNYLLGKSASLKFTLANILAEIILLNPGIPQPVKLLEQLNKIWIIPNCVWRYESSENKRGHKSTWIKEILVAEK